MKLKKCWHYLLFAVVINFFVTRKCQKIQKVDENRRKSFYLPNDLRDFNEIFRKDVTYDNVKSYKKVALHPVSKRCIFGKATGGNQTTQTFYKKTWISTKTNYLALPMFLLTSLKYSIIFYISRCLHFRIISIL